MNDIQDIIYSNYQKSLEEIHNSLNLIGDNEELIVKIHKELIEAEENGLSNFSLDFMVKSFKESILGISNIVDILIISVDEVNILGTDFNYEKYFPIDEIGEKYLYVRLNSDNEATIYDHYIINFIRLNLENFVTTTYNAVTERNKVLEIDDILQTIPYPLALISKNGDLVYYNNSFSKLNLMPSECLTLQTNDTIEKNNTFYKVFITEGEKQGHYVFVEQDEDILENELNKSSQELGIITSSIAHELNNPLAGILAAISYLELEDGMTSEDSSLLLNMKNSAKRCKELIDVFLGFSKYNPGNNEGAELKDAITQALTILRFRMIESNITVDMNYLQNSNNRKSFNISVISMMIYLLFNEIMTEYAHYNLVAENVEVESKILKVDFFETDFSFEFRFNQDFRPTQKVFSSKLIRHLIDIENLNPVLDRNTLSFVKK